MQQTIEQLGLAYPKSELPHFIVVEGPIGAGKSTLARALAYSLNYDVLLERPQDNPFLDRFYQDKDNYALQTQLSFLFQRTRQLDQLKQGDMFRPRLVADFMLEKDALFAQATLDTHELDLYTKVHDQVVVGSPTPDIVVYLQAPVSILLERIKMRGIESEKSITASYLERLNSAYMNFFHQYSQSPLLIVNAEEIDFANNPDHYRDLMSRIIKTKAGRHFYNPSTIIGPR